MSEHEIKLGDLSLTSNTFVFTVSREQALMYGMDDYTPEELAERNAKMAAFHAEQRELRVQMLRALADLRNMSSLGNAILDLHSGDTEAEWSTECSGCDVDGYDAEQPGWPCRTVVAVAKHYGIDMPDRALPGKHYEGEFVPHDGKRWTPPVARWHTAFIERPLDASTFEGEEPK